MNIRLINYGYMKPPIRAYYNDAGMDVHAPYDITVGPHDTVKIPLRFGLELPDGCVGFIFPRSGLSSKGIVCQLPPIDSGYRGEVHAVVSNLSDKPFEIRYGDRIGQLVILPVIIANLVTDAPTNTRGSNGFGSTGK